LVKNKENLIKIIDEFHNVVEDEETKQLMEVLSQKMNSLDNPDF
jgi:hypothetical protein